MAPNSLSSAPPPVASAAAAGPHVRGGSLERRALRYMLTTGGLMVALYALAYNSWDANSGIGRGFLAYLETVAQLSAITLRALGEQITVAGTTVSGRFSYVVVVDCAALDVQALFVAAVVAFPSPWRTRLIGLVGGITAIFTLNILRLVVLYYAGATSLDLFNTLHEEVFVLLIVALVCGIFLAWARWATLSGSLSPPSLHVPTETTPSLGNAP